MGTGHTRIIVYAYPLKCIESALPNTPSRCYGRLFTIGPESPVSHMWKSPGSEYLI